jgi:hypothetical protein
VAGKFPPYFPGGYSFQYRQESGFSYQFKTGRKFFFHITQSHKAKVPHFVKSTRQNMLQKAPDKLIGFQGHPFAQPTCFVVLVGKSNPILFVLKQPVVA